MSAGELKKISFFSVKPYDRSFNLKKFILSFDNTSGCMGSGGYSISEGSERAVLWIQELNRSGSKKIKVRVKKNIIMVCSDGAPAIEEILLRGLKFFHNKRMVSDEEALRQFKIMCGA